jgi:4-amino-4-deoxy-L-arabinose transferase-like glycosyltransferase
VLRRPVFRSPAFIVLVGFLFRAAILLAVHTWRVPAVQDHYLYGAEVGRMARSIATGQGFLNPFDLPIPSAWLSPGYPLLLAGVFRITGVYSNASALIIFLIQCLAQAATAIFVWQIGRLCFSPRVALAAAWLWALWPDSMPYAFQWIWETPVTVFFFTWAIVLTLRLRGISASGDEASRTHRNPKVLWPLFGLAWGLVSLFNPSLLLVLPVAAIWILLSSPQPLARKLSGALVAAVIFLALFTPWMVRNYRVFHAFVPARTNLGVEFCLGNCHGIAGAFNLVAHPAFDPEERARMLQLGELGYGREKMAQAKAAIRSSPGTFVEASVYRAYFFWFGIFHGDLENPALSLARRLLYSTLSVAGLLGLALAFRHRRPAAGFFLWLVALIPLPGYFVILISTRFRNPLDPLLTLGAVYLFSNAIPSWRIRPSSRFL